MERKLAEQLIQHFLALDKPLNEAGQLVETIDDAALQLKMKGAIADVVLSVYTDLIRPLVRQYPNLDPKDGGPRGACLHRSASDAGLRRGGFVTCCGPLGETWG
jgi:hypothetical protein